MARQLQAAGSRYNNQLGTIVALSGTAMDGTKTSIWAVLFDVDHVPDAILRV